MPLSDIVILNARPQARPYRMHDARGLFLIVTTPGGKWWRFKYHFEGREKLLSLGTCPDTGLKEAREKREEARKLVTRGIDPSARRKALKAAKRTDATNSFEVVARE